LISASMVATKLISCYSFVLDILHIPLGG